MSWRLTPMVLLALVVVGCSVTEPFLCRKESLLAVLPTPRVAGEDAFNDTLAGGIDRSRSNPAPFDQLESAFEGANVGGDLVFELGRGLDHGLVVSFRIQTPIRAGDTYPVTAVHDPTRGATWTILPAAGPDFSIGVRLDDFVATSARGTARVLTLDPFRLQLDAVVSNGVREIPLTGTMTVRHDARTESCFE